MASTTQMENRGTSTGHPLDNVIWQALGTEQARFAHVHALSRKFIPDVSSLGSLLEPSDEAYDALGSLMDNGDAAALALTAPREPPAGWIVVRAAPMLQMVHEGKILPSAGHSSVPA